MAEQNKIEQFYKKAVEGIDEKWFSNPLTDWYPYIINLPKPLKQVYLVSILDWQVNNGGFEQYFSNHYGLFTPETIQTLIDFNCPIRSKLLKISFDIIKPETDSYEMFRYKLVNNQYDQLDDEKVNDLLDDISDVYNNINEEDVYERALVYLSPFKIEDFM